MSLTEKQGFTLAQLYLLSLVLFSAVVALGTWSNRLLETDSSFAACVSASVSVGAAVLFYGVVPVTVSVFASVHERDTVILFALSMMSIVNLTLLVTVINFVSVAFQAFVFRK